MKELLAIYEEETEKANIKKYRDKIELIEHNMEEERSQFVKEIEQEDKKLQEEEPALMEPEHIDISESDDTLGSLERTDEKDKEKKTLVKRFGKKN